jgi:predicted alpha/beta superfamily hydrolase
MKNFTRTSIAALVLIAGIMSSSCTDKGYKAKESNAIKIGVTDSLFSKELNEQRKLWVYVPDNYKKGSQTLYPVVYLLDGDGHFYSVAGMIHQLSMVNGNTICPEMIVVGIPNTDRTRDLTPTHVDIDFFSGDSLKEKSGGGGRFLDFIEKELIPYVEKTYPAAGYRTFIGHSYGGLSVINALISRPQVFNNYVAIDPSLWWDNQRYLKYADSVLSINKFDGKSLFVGVANTMGEEFSINNVRGDTAKATAHIRSILSFAEKLEKNKDNGLNFQWQYFNDDDHGSVPLITEYNALRSQFSWYRLPKLDRFFDKTNNAVADDMVKVLTDHYKEVSKRLGYNNFPAEELINSLAYYFMNEKRFDFAVALFDMNIKNYPNSSNVYDSRGDCFLAQQDSLKGLEYFEKALKIGPNPDSQKKIDQLKQKMKLN